ncbi:MAG: hypothetical protein EOO68_20170, partial [Moraxellaceae bacterium]
DLPRGQQSGLAHALRVLENIDEIHITHFHSRDVVRHQLVQKIVEAYEGFDEPVYEGRYSRSSGEQYAKDMAQPSADKRSRQMRHQELMNQNDSAADAQHIPSSNDTNSTGNTDERTAPTVQSEQAKN